MLHRQAAGERINRPGEVVGDISSAKTLLRRRCSKN